MDPVSMAMALMGQGAGQQGATMAGQQMGMGPPQNTMLATPPPINQQTGVANRNMYDNPGTIPGVARFGSTPHGSIYTDPATGRMMVKGM